MSEQPADDDGTGPEHAADHGEPTELEDGTDVTVDPAELEPGATPPTSATSDATAYAEDGETQGGTGGLDAGGAG